VRPLPRFYTRNQMIILPRQAWDRHRENSKNGDVFFPGAASFNERIPGGASGHETDKISPSSPGARPFFFFFPELFALLYLIAGTFRSFLPAGTKLLAKGTNPLKKWSPLEEDESISGCEQSPPTLFLTFACVCVSRACLGKRSFFMDCLDYENSKPKGSVSAGHCNSGLAAVLR
jgi:hypothetical protein